MKAYVSPLVDEKLISYLEEKGCSIYFVKGSLNVSEPVRMHPDIYYCQLKDRLYEGDASLLSEKYPGDVLYNAAAAGKYLICSRYTSEDLIEKAGLIPVIVPQGYVKCNLCIVDDYHVITEDEGIYKVLTSETDIECLLISKGQVLLPGYKYGFIGGCTGKAGNEIIFNGDISKHSDYMKIKEFIEAAGCSMKGFSYPLLDIGSILFE